MKLLISGEGPSDLGACNNAQGRCSDEDFNRGPMAVWLARLWEARLHYNLLDIPGAVVFISETALDQRSKQAGKRMQILRGKKQFSETGFYFNNALQLGLMAKQLAADSQEPVMAVLFRDADGTRSAPGQLWKAKQCSILKGFFVAEFKFGVPMLPKPKSEAWLLCAGQTGQPSYARLENISGNDNAPNSAKKQWDALMGSRQTAAQEAEWCANNPADWNNLLTMPSFKEFHKCFHDIANDILQSAKAER